MTVNNIYINYRVHTCILIYDTICIIHTCILMSHDTICIIRIYILMTVSVLYTLYTYASAFTCVHWLSITPMLHFWALNKYKIRYNYQLLSLTSVIDTWTFCTYVYLCPFYCSEKQIGCILCIMAMYGSRTVTAFWQPIGLSASFYKVPECAHQADRMESVIIMECLELVILTFFSCMLSVKYND